MFKEERRPWRPKTLIEAIEGPPRREVRFERMCVPAIGSPSETEKLRMKDPMFNGWYDGDGCPTTKGEPK